jgi:hypothetical protein
VRNVVQKLLLEQVTPLQSRALSGFALLHRVLRFIEIGKVKTA